MEKILDTFILNVGFIVNESIGYRHAFEFEFAHVQLEDDLVLDDLKGTVRVSRASKGLLVQAEFSALTETACGRCLNRFMLPLEIEFSELYTFHSHADEDTEVILSSNHRIDLEPLLREYLLLAIPINPVCRPDCQGLCPICGASLEDDVCGCERDLIDPRMAKLKTLLDDQDD